ncbi:MAG TPA: SRPBCC family protein [Gaiellaceae bacterium]
MSTMTQTTVQVYQLFIKATPEQIWEAIVDPELTSKYFYGSRITVTPEGRVSTSPDGSESWGDSEVLEWDPPRKLVHGWVSAYDPELANEATSRVTWEIEPQDGGMTKLTLVHDRLEGAPRTAESVAGGWMLVLSGLKTLLETGEPLV